MSYRSRVYRQRNANTHEDAPKEGFFRKGQDVNPDQKKSSFFQPKLSVNEPGDSYEKEADAVASAVVDKSAGAPAVQQKKISSIQRLSSSAEDEKMSTSDARMAKDKEIQEKPLQRTHAEGDKEEKEEIQKKEMPSVEEEKEKKPVQTKPQSSAPSVGSKLSSNIESSAGKGKALPKNTLHEMNASFGTDFSGVRIHMDSDAIAMNSELQAQAFTHGQDIYFNSGKYAPENSQGKFLLAHELTHVVQQNDGLQETDIQRKVIGKNVTTSRAMLETLGMTREEVIAALEAADADAIVLARSAEDMLIAQLALAVAGDTVDANAEQILNEELGLSYNNPTHRGLIRQQIRRFKTVRETLQSGYLRYIALGIGKVQLIGCQVGECGPNHAFSCPGNRLVVLCQAYWDNTAAEDRSSTIMHEPFHIWFHMASHDTGALRRADASCFESFALRASGKSALRSCVDHTGG
ncbi:MAG: DUF4157 domain-containing protein [Chitinophagaceae bacterium]|nr:DUF4157 domain-containing protein [Chitinophagaceae bacterium]